MATSLLVACSRSVQLALASMKRTSARILRCLALLTLSFAFSLLFHRLLLPFLLLHLQPLLLSPPPSPSALLPLIFSPVPAFFLANFIVLAILVSSPTPPPDHPDSLLPSFPATSHPYETFSYSAPPLEPEFKPVKRKETSSSPTQLQQPQKKPEQRQLQQKKKQEQTAQHSPAVVREGQQQKPTSASRTETVVREHPPPSASATVKDIHSELAVVTSPQVKHLQLAVKELPTSQEPPRTPKVMKEQAQPKRVPSAVPAIPKPQTKQLATTDRASKEEPRAELVVKEASQPKRSVSAVAAILQKETKQLPPAERPSEEQTKGQLVTAEVAQQKGGGAASTAGRRIVRSKSEQRISETAAASPKVLRRSDTINGSSMALKANFEEKPSTESLSDDELNKRFGDFIANHLAKMKKESLECTG